MMTSNDRERLERVLRTAVLAGDDGAWGLLYRRALGSLRTFVLQRCGGSPDAAEETLQETWMVAVRRIRRFDPGRGSFESWLRGIADNVLRNQSRRRRLVDLHEPASILAPRDADAGPRERIIAVLLALPTRYRAVLRAKYVGENSVAEIAAAWDESPKAVESLLSRARVAFRGAWERGEEA